MEEFRGKYPHELVTHLKSKQLHTAFVELYKLTLLVLTIPSTSASTERSFSALMRIKSFQRSTQGQERLSSLALMSIEKKLKEIRKSPTFHSDVIEEFSKKERRMEFTFKQCFYNWLEVNVLRDVRHVYSNFSPSIELAGDLNVKGGDWKTSVKFWSVQRLAWGLCARGPPDNCYHAHALRWHWCRHNAMIVHYDLTHLSSNSNDATYSQGGEGRIPRRTLEGQYGGKRPVERPWNRWEDMVQEDTTNLLRLQNWKVAARDREEWRGRIGEAMAQKWAEEP
ncbi:hypothetical protein ANN_00721 [Periplaneta americana]|uniref:HAT C-terminal dimerisation domain-containing protein n=1 Tax=Periplaneta americana TaxID=6978 RepID=A0ABQ8TRK0_PERAM|nr:hypothetical protein ANN_00721 [Periplaneta americana]